MPDLQNADIDPKILAWSRLPGPDKVLAAARRRYESGKSLKSGTLKAELGPEERRNVGRLLGLAWLHSRKEVSAALLARILSERVDIEALLTELGGPIVRRPEVRAREAAAKRTAAETVRRILLSAGAPENRVDSLLAQRGMPTGSDLIRLCDEVAAVLRLLPRGSPRPESTVLLQVLAARATGDPHALDWNRPLARNVIRLSHGSDPQGRAAWTEAWEELSVVCDELSSRVLVHNLVLCGDAPACALTSAVGGEPVWLTYRSLRRGTFAYAGTAEVRVCENPSIVVEAAQHLGSSGLPLVCTNGNPTRAALVLISRLAQTASLLVSADDDAAGQRIVARIRAVAPSAGLWHYTVRDPAEAARRPGYEEQRVDRLIDDLSPRGGPAAPLW